jgi:polyisoprenoid-binding protein YceI
MNTSIRTSLKFAAAFSAAALSSHAAPQSFDFKDPKGVNNVQFQLDAPLESITGTANGITGAVTFDLEVPGATTGRIVVDAASLTVGNALMREHLLGDNWLDVAKHPTITFEAARLANVRHQGAQIIAVHLFARQTWRPSG